VNPRVRFDDEADAEYRSAGRWYEARRNNLGIEFFDAVDATIDQIVTMPRAGSMVGLLPVELTVRRRAVQRFPYHVVYLELPTHIRILAIAHDRRKPGYWNERVK
jgi:plasmid stabilization system protein ParE